MVPFEQRLGNGSPMTGDNVLGDYEVLISGHNVRVVGRGFWSVDVALAFGREVPKVVQATRDKGKLCLDLSGLKPMRDEGQVAFSDLFQALRAAGIPYVEIATSSPLTKLQLLRLANESRMGQVVKFMQGTGG